MTIATPPPVSAKPLISTIVGATMAPTGAAIVRVSLDGSEPRRPVRTCTGIERLPYDVAQVAARLKAIELEPRDVVVVDGAGAGMALWIALGSPRGNRHWKLYGGLGRERQKLVDPVPAMVIDGTLAFAADVPDLDAMLKALTGYRREVQDDGIVGSELAVALFLALTEQPARVPRIY